MWNMINVRVLFRRCRCSRSVFICSQHGPHLSQSNLLPKKFIILRLKPDPPRWNGFADAQFFGKLPDLLGSGFWGQPSRFPLPRRNQGFRGEGVRFLLATIFADIAQIIIRTPRFILVQVQRDMEEFSTALKRPQEKGYVQVTEVADGLDVSLDGLFESIDKETKAL